MGYLVLEEGTMNDKKIVIYKETDGHKIIVGFDSPMMDPEATKAALVELVPATDEHKALEAKKAEYNEAYRALIQARKSNNESAYKSAMEAMEGLQAELMDLAGALEDKIRELRLENAVYFEPKRQEEIVEATEALRLSEAIKQAPAGVLVSLDGIEIPDQRGTTYFHKISGKWKHGKVVKLGDKVPVGATLEANVTEAQYLEIERDRVSGLSVIQKAEEKKLAIAKAMNLAKDIRIRLEIENAPDALEQSQNYYQGRLQEIVALYG